MNAPSPTSQQQRAIAARGNVLVVAGAGAGKTQTVIDRCLAWLLDESNAASVDELLMVTFTNAAAAEMRQRLRQALEKISSPSPRVAEQLALLDTAHICTLHSFCFHLVSRHFYELGLDPAARILPEERTALLARQCLDRVLAENYAATTPSAMAVQQLIQSQGGDWDAPVRKLALRMHEHAQTLRDPEAWFKGQTALFAQPEPAAWLEWLMEELPKWRDAWLKILSAQPAANTTAAKCAQALSGLPKKPDRSEFAAALTAILAADENWPKPKAQWRKPIEKMFDEAEFLQSLCDVGETDPLVEDWNWAREPMLALLDFTGQFDRAFQAAKRQEGGIDYHDLEQFALRLLWKDGQPTDVARQWRKKLRLIFVDEYQDINEAQDAIIQALGREGADANRFMVGDVKQSIYGFRLADPRIFGKRHEAWQSGNGGNVIPLTENFRSHQGILDFVNAVFAELMNKETGGVNYTEDVYLRFGNAAARAHLAANPASPPPVELLLRCPALANEEEESLSDAEKEARMVGRRLLELKEQRTKIFDRSGAPRVAAWSDMVVLLRSPSNKVEAYAREFGRLGIPLIATRGGFYESLEVRDLLGLLQMLDNPLQDLPLLGVLRSPLVGLTVEELAVIRIAHRKEHIWTALVQWHEKPTVRTAHYDKVHEFLRRFEAWRGLSRQSAVSLCLERVIDETHYDDWLATQERGAQRSANVQRLLQLTRQFDAYDGESLYRFLKFVEAQQENETPAEPAAAPETDAVRLMSIHQSKGLEFPVVALADLGKQFNFSDLTGRIILDEEFGLCPQIQPPQSPQFYPSLPHWLAQRRQKRKLLAEEMRLLYVAMTRASHRLILAGTVGKKNLDEKWPLAAQRAPAAPDILAARRFLDWLGPWFLRACGPDALQSSGGNQLLTWTLEHENEPATAEPIAAKTEPEAIDVSPEQRDRLIWQYPFRAETRQPAKTSVTTIRRQLADIEGLESSTIFSSQPPRGEVGGTEIGSAHHLFMQWVGLDKVQSAAALKSEAARLGREGLLGEKQIAALDFDALESFWNSETGRLLLSQSACLRRELAFTARFGAAELRDLGCAEFVDVAGSEFVVVQGVTDLAAMLPREIWLLDFKTDRVRAGMLNEKIKAYRPQIALYAMALERIHQKPVTRRWLHFLAARQTVPV